MAKIYTKTTHVDETLAGDELYNILESDDTPIHSGVKIELSSTVVQAGTAHNAATMNNIEDAVDALDDIVNVDGITLIQESGTDTLGVGAIADGDFLTRVSDDIVGKTVAQTKTILGVDVKKKCGLVSNPQAVFAQRAQIPIMLTDAAITITRIHIHCSDTTPTAELAGDLKFADDINVGGFANATVIDVCDTTNGVVTITSGFDDATVPSGKYIYFQMDASPHADIKDFYLEVFYTYD